MNALIHFHSGWRWVVLLALIVAVINAFKNKNKPFEPGGKKAALYALVASHIQLLIGFVLFFTSPKVVFSGSAMRDEVLRFFLVEHNTLMIIAVLLITIGYSRSKKAHEDFKKFKAIRIFYLIGLILILVGIPWPWQNYAAGWF